MTIGGAGANRVSPALVPSPRGIIVGVVRIRALDVRAATAPIDAERVEDIRLAAGDGSFDFVVTT